MLFDLLALAGLATLATGLWWMHPAMALSVVGSLIFALAACGAINERRERARRKLFARVKRLKLLGDAAQEFDDEQN